MRTYPYACKCGHKFDVMKSMTDIDQVETCPECKAACDSSCRYIARTHFFGAKVEDVSWNPGLGKFTRSAKHRAELAKRAGAIEIGNETPDSMHKTEEKIQAERDAVNYHDQIKW